jgi:hypothetical protein
MAAEKPIDRPVEIVPQDDHQVVDEDVRTQKDRARPQYEPERMQRRQVFVIDVAKEGLLDACNSQPNAARWWSEAAERSLLAVLREGP